MIKEALWDGMDGWDWMVIICILRAPSVPIKHDLGKFSDTFSVHIHIMEGLPRQKQQD